MKRIILMAVAAILFFSCNKEAENHFAKSKKTTQPSSHADDFSFHKHRFYDSLGILHNQILASFHQLSNENNVQAPEYFQQFLSEYMRKKEGGKVKTSNVLPPEKVLDIIKRYLRNDFGTIENPEVEYCLRNIFNTVKATNSFDTVLYKQRLIQLGKQIQKNKQLRPGEKNMLLATTVIARHSGCYWLNFFAMQGENFPTSHVRLFNGLLAALGVTIADATAIAYDYFANRPIMKWVEDAAWFSQLGYWSIDHILSENAAR